MNQSGPWWLTVLGSGVVLWLLNKAWSIWVNRRRLPTNAVTVLQNASVSQIELTRQDNARLRNENERLDGERRELDHRNDLLMDAVRDLLAYSQRQSAEIRRLGGVIEDPPPLPPEFQPRTT